MQEILSVLKFVTDGAKRVLGVVVRDEPGNGSGVIEWDLKCDMKAFWLIVYIVETVSKGR